VLHALGLAAALAGDPSVGPTPAPTRAMDLGAGGGIPGLVLAALWPRTAFVYLDANRRRTSFLESAVERLGWVGRVSVRCVRAEMAGREQGLRAGFDLVVARGFGPPPATAECAAPFLRLGGLLLVSEPPPDGPSPEERWPAEGCRLVGLDPVLRVTTPVSAQILRQASLCSERYPRRDGMPTKRLLF
jgi:16S rRNA (guanine527-N7)-methyltransferase